ncbi:hypothetical protein LTR12_016769 [Friedmanniomyces endolithicus]|nr:hypothetical protein LTR12_016769 [Friedmanniomyces endolithicus]
MAHTSRFYVKPVSQAFAEKAATDGLCGDVLHTEKCAITQCTLSKSMAVRTANASYCIIHANSVPGTVMGRQPRRLAPTSQSREFLSEARRQFYGVGAATAGVDYAASTSHRESKSSATTTPAPPKASVRDSPPLRASRATPSSGTPKTQSVSTPTAGPQVQPTALARTLTVDLRASIEETLHWVLDQNRVQPSKEDDIQAIAAITALKTPAAANRHVMSPSTVSTAVHDQVPAESNDASKVTAKNEESVYGLPVTPVAPEKGADRTDVTEEGDWEVVDLPKEEARAKVSFRGRLASRFFGSRLR